ncbi:HD-GYP domain-containing protein [Paenibacillus harenae]|uniref:HD-GYP domain-containing protein n=1 Tax=Paenibacillus harenae TaxID=306543 RepID=UPI00278D6898|nr:HD domain-containing phosphohydrolase [Paenibacillus harenae]MDQ0061025.1 HD-GYP domain-containing protein (c-di-GMP phosphodiesterase class II) [Paenibacillus harenae]
MREADVTNLKEGDLLAKPILADNGTMILGKGTVMTELYIKRLIQRKIRNVWIEHREGQAQQSEPPLIPDNKPNRTLLFNQIIDRLDNHSLCGHAFSGETEQRHKRLYRNSVNDFLSQSETTSLLAQLQAYDQTLYEHAIDVSILSTIIGMECGYDAERMLELTIGSLLFDIGMTQLPAAITAGERNLTAREQEQLESHTALGFRMLLDIQGMPAPSAQCALLHHERYDGSGYPLRIKGSVFPEYAQIVALSDLYARLLAKAKRQSNCKTDDVIEFMFASGNHYFNADLVKIFLKQITAYPLLSVLKLSNGQTGIVKSYNSAIIHRPVVQIIRDAEGNDLNAPYEIDLALSRNLTVLHAASYS